MKKSEPDSLMVSEQSVNTLKEIGELKSEIMKLTCSLRSLKNSPVRESNTQDSQGIVI